MRLRPASGKRPNAEIDVYKRQVYNCAAAGYSVTAHAYQGSVLYMGGFVGYNAGTIRSGSVSTPSLTASSNYARLLMGGFTGGNSGLVSQSYAMANVEVLQILSLIHI